MGLVHIYFGEGKGKTTAAMGLALRALGRGLRVCVCQFLKDASSGEIRALAPYESVNFLHADGMMKQFLWEMSEFERADCFARQRALLDRLNGCSADLFVLDEALAALSAGVFSSNDLLQTIDTLRQKAEVVLTGREAPNELLNCADYITRMENLRHPYERGVRARRGIEY